MHLIFLDINELKHPSTRDAALRWLQGDLAANTLPWCVLTLSEPLFGATRIHARAVETLGTILETGGVDLVISGGADHYFRTLPIQAGDSSAVRYVVTGGLNASGKPLSGREYKSASANVPHYCILEADQTRLEWKVMPVGGFQPLDQVTIFTDNSSLQGEPAIEKMDILTDALSTLTLQREVLTIARSAARAYNDPQGANQLSLTLANASPRDITGELIWNVPAGSAYRIEPEAVKFDLKSGFEGIADFSLTPYVRTPNAPMPELVVNMHGVGSARQQLILTQRKNREIYPVIGGITVDGIMEEEWDYAQRLTDFGVIGGGGKPKLPIEARVAYDERGIYMIARCAAKDAETIAVTAKNHDDPVHRDESVEFFIDARNRGREYYQFAVNVKGVTLDRSSQLGLAWNPRWQSAVTRSRNHYTVEVFIPYQALGLSGKPSPESRWGFNISRNDYQMSAVYENPLERTPAAAAATATTSGRISRFNIGDMARQDLGPDKVPVAPAAKDTRTPEGPGLEIVQWADTYGANDRSGLYGNIIFKASRPAPVTPTPPAAPATPEETPAPATPVTPPAPVAPVAPIAPVAPVTPVTPEVPEIPALEI